MAHFETETMAAGGDAIQSTPVLRLPGWIRRAFSEGERYAATARAVHGNRLHTVCEEARCPNRGECWSRGTATFMLLGDICTRACGFCAVKTGRPGSLDGGEPERIAAAVVAMRLRYVVLTSVNRDDLPDGGASVFALTLRGLWRMSPAVEVELLTPDFRNVQDLAVQIMREAIEEDRPADAPADRSIVWGHNLETVPRLYRHARKGSRYERSLDLLARVAAVPRIEAKSALMLGLGETQTEVVAVMEDLRRCGVRRLSLGQYLRPSREHLPVAEYVHPDAFAEYERIGRGLGFKWIKAGPLVRSSFQADEIQNSN